MKIIAVVDDENYISPLEYGNSIMVIDDQSKQIKEYENPGFGATHGGKERAMAAILTLKADAIVVKEGSLCPGSYFMSHGRLKYIPVEYEKFDEVMKNLDSIRTKAQNELEPLMYQE